MAHFAEIDENGIVLQVLVVPDSEEHRGQEFLANDLGLGGTWIQTSYNDSIRKRYAGIGMEYNTELDAFLWAKPFDYWILNEEEARYFPPDWEVGKDYEVDYTVTFNGRYYQVVQAHTSQADWTPDITVSLFKIYDRIDEGQIPDWRQPTGSHDAYPEGYQVQHNGKVWESLISANVWPPEEGELWKEIQ